MRVFVTGATGYIGKAVSKAFRAKGHTVYGLVRSQEIASALSFDEIWPVIGDMRQPESYTKILQEVEVAVHCALDASDKTVELDALTIDTILKTFEQSPLPKAFIYTSGVWVYGSTGYKTVDESTPVNPIDLIKWRSEHEQKVLNAASSKLRTVIMRPGIVYGKAGGLTDIFFTTSQNGETVVIEEGRNRWAMIHAQDLAYAYVAAAEKEISNTILNITDESSYTMREMAEEIARVNGTPGKIYSLSKEEALKQLGSMSYGLMLDQQVSNARLKRLLGWQTHHLPYLNEIEIYLNAWKAKHQIEGF